MNGTLLQQAARHDLTVAGSLLTVPAPDRPATAEHLWHHHAWAHIDIIDGTYGPRPGIDPATVHDLTGHGPTDVHLMVDHPETVINALPAGLTRITIQADRLTPHQRTRALTLAREHADQAWLAYDTAETPRPDPHNADGLLFMLLAPGVPGQTLDPHRVTRLSDSPDLPRGVDGGVDTPHLHTLAGHGVTYVVAGRALLAPGRTTDLPSR